MAETKNDFPTTLSSTSPVNQEHVDHKTQYYSYRSTRPMPMSWQGILICCIFCLTYAAVKPRERQIIIVASLTGARVVEVAASGCPAMPPPTAVAPAKSKKAHRRRRSLLVTQPCFRSDSANQMRGREDLAKMATPNLTRSTGPYRLCVCKPTLLSDAIVITRRRSSLTAVIGSNSASGTDTKYVTEARSLPWRNNPER